VERQGTRLADAMNSGRIGFHLLKEVRGGNEEDAINLLSLLDQLLVNFTWYD
jgi:hypothetical protein